MECREPREDDLEQELIEDRLALAVDHCGILPTASGTGTTEPTGSWTGPISTPVATPVPFSSLLYCLGCAEYYV